MRLASVDIGSNAIRLQVVNLQKEDKRKPYKKIEFIRFPLRLGHDVFKLGKITRPTEEKLVKLMQAFKILMDIYEVDDYMACATSAMREAANGQEITERIYYQHGLKVQIIDGNTEAEITNLSLSPYLPEGHSLHIDVGGGSTELNLYAEKQKIAAKSFKIGSVRSGMLTDEERDEVFTKMKQWLYVQEIDYEQSFTAIGTGGNINKLFSLSPQKENKDKTTTVQEIETLKSYLEQFTFKEKVEQLRLNKDRADVIVPAAEIYINCIKMVRAENIIVPGVGMKDGILQYMMHKMKM